MAIAIDLLKREGLPSPRSYNVGYSSASTFNVAVHPICRRVRRGGMCVGT